VSDHVRLRVGSELYALPVENVLEVAELGELSAVPGAEAVVLGVRNLHGQVLPVFDLAQVLTCAGEATARRIVVAEHAGRLAGLAVDEVTDVSPLPAAIEEADAEYLSGALLEDGRLLGVIDVDRLFGGLGWSRA
jgi:purine-binding chemotaxis protein CheW